MKSYSFVHDWYPTVMGHGVSDQQETSDRQIPPAVLDAASAAQVAETLQALATPSRLLILARLRREPASVTRLAADVGMEQSAVSHQLRLLRHLGLVVGTKHGKNTVYALHDNHVAMLLDQAVYHIDHLRLGIRDQVGTAVPDKADV